MFVVDFLLSSITWCELHVSFDLGSLPELARSPPAVCDGNKLVQVTKILPWNEHEKTCCGIVWIIRGSAGFVWNSLRGNKITVNHRHNCKLGSNRARGQGHSAQVRRTFLAPLKNFSLHHCTTRTHQQDAEQVLHVVKLLAGRWLVTEKIAAFYKACSEATWCNC